jgi:hypothetical protein
MLRAAAARASLAVRMKAELLDKIRKELRLSLERVSQAARDAHAAATDPGSKAEGKYDTRSLEASYLAAGQARQVDELANALRIFESLEPAVFGPGDEIDAGALAEVEMAAGRQWFLLAPVGGGMEISHDEREITLLTPDSPLYRKLVGLRAGDSIDAPPLTVAGVW